ncbi:MAG: patatin-like phospholipase family protein [Marinobacter sp.]|nr:patatin-like phospholipase family protein [Marinobacter sp.]
MTAQFRNLVFEGGGVKGIAYVGAMQVLAQRGILPHILRVGGTSAGAINALVYALGYDLKTQQQILDSTDFRDFMDSAFGFIRDFRRLWKEFGWHKGDFFSDWVGGLVKDRLGKSGATFSDLHKAGLPDLFVVGTNLSTGYSEVFSRERHPTMSLVTAVRISMSLPLFFRAKRLGAENQVFVDGGVMLNYPVKLFDRERYIDMVNDPAAARAVEYYNRENARFLLARPDRSPYVYNRQTLGLRLDTEEEIGLYRYDEAPVSKAISTFPIYARALVGALLQVQENQHLHGDDWQRTVYINTLDVRTTDFNLSAAKKQALIEQGILGTERYFQWFEDPAETPVNRVPVEHFEPQPLLSRGDRGPEVVRLQGRLNRCGAMLRPDGDYGPATERGVRYAQDCARQTQSGVADGLLWSWLATLQEPFPLLDTNGVAFIAVEESGGLAYYDAHTRWPHFPGEASGITIGLGYDLRWNSEADFLATWGDILPAKDRDELIKDIGKAGTAARANTLKKQGLSIPFKAAWQVFVAKTLPRYYHETKSIYPSLDRLPPMARAVLVSLVFNRGTSLNGETRREMKTIQTLLAEADQLLPDKTAAKAVLVRVEDEITSMQRLWSPSSGLVKRRQAEANLWREALANW